MRTLEDIENDKHYHHYVRVKDNICPQRINMHVVDDEGRVTEKLDYEVEMLAPTLQDGVKSLQSLRRVGEPVVEQRNKFADIELSKLITQLETKLI